MSSVPIGNRLSLLETAEVTDPYRPLTRSFLLLLSFKTALLRARSVSGFHSNKWAALKNRSECCQDAFKIQLLSAHLEVAWATCGHILQADAMQMCPWLHRTTTYLSDVLSASGNMPSFISTTLSENFGKPIDVCYECIKHCGRLNLPAKDQETRKIYVALLS